jgi:nucleoid-associated protein EbfC
MGMFDKAKDLYQLQRQAKKIKDELGAIHIEATEGGVTITINGEQKVISTVINFEHYASDQSKIQNDITTAINKGIKKSQEIAAEKMKGIMGNFGLPGGAAA